MSTTILTTKLFIPPARKELVFRQGLIERLNQGMEKKLILVSGPAGFGKTTLLSQWVAQCARPVAWLSLDEGDNEGKRFIQYLIHAIQGISMGIGGEILELIHSVITPDVEEIGPYLVNQLAKFHQPFLVVLDDYHVISLPGHSSFVTALAFSPDGQLLASLSWDGTLRLWGIPTNE